MWVRRVFVAVLGCALLAAVAAAPSQARVLQVSEFKQSDAKLAQIRQHQMDRLLATH
jgi:hypothetical protein